jgi:hypothetical protein
MRRALAAAVVAALTLPGCTVGVRRSHAKPSPSPVSTSPVPVPECATTYAKPDPHRPKITLRFDGDDEHPGEVVHGSETVVFTPDQAITEVVFRLWPNNPLAREHGASMTVDRASLPTRTEAAGGTDDHPTLVALTLPKPSPAGRAVTVSLDFTFALPKSSVDRWGRTANTYWWGSGHPLLAWVRGQGWATDPAVGLLGETATSEVADYDVSVEAPSSYTVVGNGVMDEPMTTGLRWRRWHFHNPAARDVAVAYGRMSLRHSVVSGIPLTVAVSDELASGADAETVFGPVTENVSESLRAHVARFGKFPFAALTVVALKPIASAGVEYPGLVMVGSKRYDVVVPHELGHQWFYGLVGDDQARDPWLDEAFATYAEALFNDSADRYLGALTSGGRVGEPMTYWDHHRDDYGRVVYAKGAAALLTARDEGGAAAFDKLLRCYVAKHAYGVVSPADLATALAPLPKAVQVLQEAGALP